jgi:hypothetical protein
LTTKLHLVLLIHGHQPVGNFDFVFEKIYRRCYLPFLASLQRHPTVRIGLHYSGPLFEWFEERHPEFLDQVQEMAERRQVELVGGGFFEPILISLPPEDQIEQLVRMRDYLTRRFGATPSGAWLTERVWEPQLPFVLSAAGVRYTLVDDIHFLAAGFAPHELCGDYTSEDRGRTVRVIPGQQQLRYLIPFRPVEDTMGFLRDFAASHPGGLAAMGDDCEKFGAWPGTFEHCYQNGWMERFLTALEAADGWLVTTPPGEYVAAHEPLGRADLPTASYQEMMEWVLPTPSRMEFHTLSSEFAARPDVLRFLHGGHWRGFFSKYREVNLLHKKMLHVSGKLGGLAATSLHRSKRAKLADARTHLLRAQCNDAYWHGIFGGLYAPHLRTACWRELIRAETLAEETGSTRAQALRVERLDFNADNYEELYVTSQRMAALIEPSEGGTLSALDFRTQGVTLINSLQRRPEAYHSRLHEAPHNISGQIASIHEQARVKEEGLDRLLRYDRWPRNCFRLLLFPEGKTFQDYQEVRLDEHAALAGGSFAIGEADPGRITLTREAPSTTTSSGADSPELLGCTKIFSFAHTPTGYQVRCAIDLRSADAETRRAQIGIELVLNLLAPDEPDRYFETPGARHSLRWAAALPALESGRAHLRVVDEWQDVAATIDAPGASHLWIAPIETVSESEEGFERVYQGSQILAVWRAQLGAGSGWQGEVTLDIEPARPEGQSKH